MKKVLGLVLVSVLALSVVACTKKKEEAPVAPEATTAPAANPAAPAEAPATK
jgi:peptidoglycan-associated lipoprotein